jgi:hypothetical protein
MADYTTNLGALFVSQSQSQKEVVINEAFLKFDALLNRGAISKAIATPPTSPVDGDLYIVAASATGAWAGKSNQIAIYNSSKNWFFITPNEGLTIWVNNEDKLYTFNGTNWVESVVATGGSGGGSATISDGDKGDIIVSGSGTNWVIENLAVTNAKIASNIDAAKISSGNVSNTEFDYLDGVTAAIQTQLNNKQPLSTILTNTSAAFTTSLESKLAGIAAGAEVNVNADWNATSGDAEILNKPTIPNAIFSTITVSGQSNIVADSASDTLTLAAGANITITTNASTDTITISASGSGGGSSSGIALLAHSGTAANLTGTTSETILATYTMPANKMPANGILRITSFWSCNSSVNTHNAKVRFGGISGTVYSSDTMASRLTGQGITHIRANNSTSSQKSFSGSLFSNSSFTTSSNVAITSSVDTTSAVDIVFTGQLANSADNMSLEGYSIELLSL